MAIRVGGRIAHVNRRDPSGSVPVQVELGVSMDRMAGDNACGSQESKSADVHPITCSNLSGTRLGVIELVIKQVYRRQVE